MRLIIAGGRDFNDYFLLCEHMNNIKALEGFFIDNLIIVCGGAKGADALGEKWANENGVTVARFPADWNRLGKKAGFIRNNKMAEYATHLLAFWDTKSRGTEHMIDIAHDLDLEYKVVKYDN